MADADSIQQFSPYADISQITKDYDRVTTDNRIVVNALVGVGLEFGDNRSAGPILYIRDTQKNTRLALGKEDVTGASETMIQDTAWYERQLIDTQVVGEFRITPEIELDVRGGFANSQREAPNEFTIEYVRTAVGPYGDYFVNC